MSSLHVQASMKSMRNQVPTQPHNCTEIGNISVDSIEVIRLLNETLATLYVGILRYRSHYFLARSFDFADITATFLQYFRAKSMHTTQLAERIKALGGTPNLLPREQVTSGAANCYSSDFLKDLIAENLVAELISIDGHRELIHYLSDQDPITADMLKDMLTAEKKHVRELASLLSCFAESVHA